MNIGLMDVNNIQENNFRLYRKNGSGDYLFVLFKSLAKVMYNGEYLDVKNGDAILYDKTQLQEYFPVENEKFIHDFMHFKTDNKVEETLLLGITKGKPFTLLRARSISELLSEIKKEIHSPFSKYQEQILTLFGNVFLYRLKDEEESCLPSIGISKPYFDMLDSLRTKIYNEPYLDWAVDEISNDLHMSRSYLQHLYKEYFSVSIKTDIINARIAYAKILLSTTEFTISEIAEKCGYNNTEHFIRQFKERTSVTPGRLFRNI